MKPTTNREAREITIPEVKEEMDSAMDEDLIEPTAGNASLDPSRGVPNTLGQLNENRKIFDKIREESGCVTVCLTAANGFLGSHILRQLLEGGYGVSAGISHNTTSETLQFISKLQKDHGSRLRYRQFDMTKIDECEELVKDCHVVIHCATTGRDQRAEHPINVLYPEIEGVLNLLTCAQKAGVRRFILMGSVSNVAAGKFRKAYNESHWAHPDDCDDHERAKLFAERTAWHFTEENLDAPFLTVFCPGMMVGPLLRMESKSSSVIFMKKLIGDRFRQVLDLKVPTVDVRDVASLVIKSIERPETFGQRYLLVEGVYALDDLFKRINQDIGVGGSSRPSIFSKLMIRVLGWFDRDLKKVLEFYGKTYKFDCEKVRREIGAEFRPLDQSLGAMVVSLEKYNIVKYSHDRVRLSKNEVLDDSYAQ